MRQLRGERFQTPVRIAIFRAKGSGRINNSPKRYETATEIDLAVIPRPQSPYNLNNPRWNDFFPLPKDPLSSLGTDN